MSCTLPRLITVVGHQEVRKNHIGFRTGFVCRSPLLCGRFYDCIYIIYIKWKSAVYIIVNVIGGPR